jgi:IclR family transcriptional regulator, KDG regulon repressor
MNRVVVDLENHNSTVRTVDRALDILLCFRERQEWLMYELADRLHLNRSTVFRLLRTLEDREFVIRNKDTDVYRLGMRFIEVSANMYKKENWPMAMLPSMEQLRDLLGETVSIYTRDRKDQVCIQAVQSEHSIRRVVKLGERLPLNTGATGKVLFAFSENDVQSLLLNDPDWCSNIEKIQFVSEIEQIKNAGYAVSFQEPEPGVSAVSAPLYDQEGNVVAALTVSGPLDRLTMDRMTEQLPMIIQAAQRLKLSLPSPHLLFS